MLARAYTTILDIHDSLQETFATLKPRLLVLRGGLARTRVHLDLLKLAR